MSFYVAPREMEAGWRLLVGLVGVWFREFFFFVVVFNVVNGNGGGGVGCQ